MIGIHASVNWNNGKMQVNLLVKGRAEHELEHLYAECIREGLRQSLGVAQAKEQEIAAKATPPAPLGENAIEIPFELPVADQAAPASTVDRPPLFSELIYAVVEDLHKNGHHVAAELVTDKAEAFMQQLAAWHRARAKEAGQ